VDRSKPLFVRAVTRTEHGDWKTQLVRDNFMGLNAGEIGEVVEVFSNFEGKWVRVRKDDGKTADVRSESLEVVDAETVNNERSKKEAEMHHLAASATHRAKHLKTGSIYFVIVDGIANATNAVEGQSMVLYTNEARDKIYVREANEFNTKFQRI
jgi:hypothetical protein